MVKMKTPFVRTPVALLRDYTHVSVGARLLWSVLMSCADSDGTRCYPGVKRLAANLNRDRKAVFSYLNELENAGFIRRFSSRRASEHATNSYQILQPPSSSPLPSPATLAAPEKTTPRCPENRHTT